MIKLVGDITIDTTLKVNRTVTLDLNGWVLKYESSTNQGRVIAVESGNTLTIEDSDTTTQHKFTPDASGLWVLDETNGTETVSGGIITGGTPADNGASGSGVYVAPDAALTMNGGSIVGCRAGRSGRGGGVYIDSDTNSDGTYSTSTFTMNSGRIIGCIADNGGGVAVASSCTFTMNNESVIRSCIATYTGGGVYIVINFTHGPGVFTMEDGEISLCKADVRGGGVFNEGIFTMKDGVLKGCTAVREGSTGGVRNYNQFIMSGGTIGAEGENDTSHVYNHSREFSVLTISGNAKIYTNVENEGRLEADGGEIFGDVTNIRDSSIITGTEGAAGSTKFSGNVKNNSDDSKGTIEKGTFTGSVSNNEGTVLGGDFDEASLSGTLVITFDPDNGGQISTQKVNWEKDGAALTAPTPAPTKEDHTLDGWYYDNSGIKTKWNFDTDKVKYTTTFTAQWKANTYTVTVENDGHGEAFASPASAAAGEEIKLTATPSSGYGFKEWQTVSVGVTIKNNKFTMPAGNVTVKAIFEKKSSGGGGGAATYCTLSFVTNGGSRISPLQGTYGKTIDLSGYVPTRDGYDFTGWYSDPELAQKIKEIKLNGSKAVYAGWTKSNPNTGDQSFTDVNASHWFYDDVMFVDEKGLMSGTRAATFAPYADTTRAQIAVIFYRMEGSPAVEGKNSFTDVEYGSGTAWLYDAVEWAQQNGIVGGCGNNQFAPNDPVTREQLAAIFYRYAQYKGYDTTQGGMAIREFDDCESISDYAVDAMTWAVNVGLINGRANNLLGPKDTAARAEIAAMLHRFIEKQQR